MDSTPERQAGDAAADRFDIGIHEIRNRIQSRRVRIEAMVSKARHYRLDVDFDVVNRHYPWFVRWDQGEIARGYLMRRTGVKEIGSQNQPWR